MNFIEWDSEKLPDFLFYYDDSQISNIPPTASFDPTSALDGQPFRSATSPSKDPIPRTLIISQDSFFSLKLTPAKHIALIKRLKLSGFKIFIKAEIGEAKKFHEIDDKLTNIEFYIDNSKPFDEETDHELIADEHSVEFDKSHAVDLNDYMEINEAFDHNQSMLKDSISYGFRQVFNKDTFKALYSLPEDKEEQVKYLEKLVEKEFDVYFSEYLFYFLIKNDNTPDSSIVSKYFKRVGQKSFDKDIFYFVVKNDKTPNLSKLSKYLDNCRDNMGYWYKTDITKKIEKDKSLISNKPLLDFLEKKLGIEISNKTAYYVIDKNLVLQNFIKNCDSNYERWIKRKFFYKLADFEEAAEIVEKILPKDEYLANKTLEIAIKKGNSKLARVAISKIDNLADWIEKDKYNFTRSRRLFIIAKFKDLIVEVVEKAFSQGLELNTKLENLIFDAESKNPNYDLLKLVTNKITNHVQWINDRGINKLRNSPDLLTEIVKKALKQDEELTKDSIKSILSIAQNLNDYDLTRLIFDQIKIEDYMLWIKEGEIFYFLNFPELAIEIFSEALRQDNPIIIDSIYKLEPILQALAKLERKDITDSFFANIFKQGDVMDKFLSKSYDCLIILDNTAWYPEMFKKILKKSEEKNGEKIFYHLNKIIETIRRFDKDYACKLCSEKLGIYLSSSKSYSSWDITSERFNFLLLISDLDDKLLDKAILELDKNNLLTPMTIDHFLKAYDYFGDYKSFKNRLKVLRRIYNLTDYPTNVIHKISLAQSDVKYFNLVQEILDAIAQRNPTFEIEKRIEITEPTLREISNLENFDDIRSKDSYGSTVDHEKREFLIKNVGKEYSKKQKITLLDVRQIKSIEDIDLILENIDPDNIVSLEIRNTSTTLVENLVSKLPNLIFITNHDLSHKKTIEISQGTLQTKRLTDNPGKEDKYKMVEAGNILHGDIKNEELKIRTGRSIINFEGSLARLVYIPKEYVEQDLRALTEDNIKQIELLKEDGYVYCQFNQIAQANTKSRLLSVDSEEEILGFLGNDKDIRLFGGDDGFFYVENNSDQTFEISYVLKSKNPKYKSKDIQTIIKGNKEEFFEIISKYIENSEKSHRLDDVPSIKDGNIKGWLNDLYDSGNGRCELRTAALCAIMHKHGFQDKIRIVSINNNHSIVEIEHEGSWFKVDLGGEAARTIKAEKSERYTPVSNFATAEFSQKSALAITSSLATSKPSFPAEENRLVKIKAALLKKIETEVDDSRKNIMMLLLDDMNRILASNPEVTEETADQLTALKKEVEEVLSSSVAPEVVEEMPSSNAAPEIAEVIPSSSTEAKIAVVKPISTERRVALKQKKLLKRKISQIRSFRKVSSVKEITKLPDNSLILTNSVEDHANFIINHSTITNKRCFYLEHPKQLRIGKKTMFVDESSNPYISRKCELEKFIEYCNLHPDEDQRPALMINWDNFSANQALKINTLLDEKQSIGGVKFDNKVDIIGLTSDKPKDVSFLTRHQNKIESSLDQHRLKIEPIFNGPENNHELSDVDLKGFPDWKKYLFGPINLVNNELVWNKSEFSKKLLAGNLKFNLKNISNESRQELLKMIGQANACGFLEYNGYKFPLDNNLEVSFEEKEFDFEEINTSGHKASMASFNQVKDATIINSFLFDILLQDKTIDQGNYIELPGLLQRNANSTLRIYTTSNLSKSQWYCLFNQAQEYNVSLEIIRDSNVYIPVNIEHTVEDIDSPVALAAAEEEYKSYSEEEIDFGELVDLIEQRGFSAIDDARFQEVGGYPKVIVTNDANDIVDLYNKKDERFAIIDIADFTYQDLVSEITFESAEDKFENFQNHLSELITRLKSGEQIVLKGNFSLEMIRLIEPILASMPPEFNKIGDNLTVIIEDKFVNPETTKTYEPLSWLGDRYRITSRELIEGELDVEELSADQILALIEGDTLENTRERPKEVFIEESPDKSLEESEDNSALFIKGRKSVFKKFLEKDSMLQLIGHSGVGKSRLLKIFEEEEKSRFEVYRELGNLDKWAKDDSMKTKILFIDESNIEDFDLTMFEPLLEGRNKRILYKGEFYNLDDHHKVVFAGNPVEYGGGRKVQKLFSNHEISEFHLKDFPACYIYENILKAALYDKLSADLKRLISEDRFKELCKLHINKYYEENAKSPETLTVRELQENLLRKIVGIYCQDQATKTHQHLSGDNYVSTSTTFDLEKEIQESILTRNLQRLRKLPNEAVGINGVFLQGQSGFGKSAMIEEILTSQRIHITHDKDYIVPSNAGAGQAMRTTICYKIDASQTKESKEEILIKAFNEGNMVWIDEINSCINDGLEKTLNSLLTGLHPQTGERSTNPGFMMLASSNSVGMTGRSKISPALRHRLSCPKVNRLSDFTVEDLQIMIDSWDATLEPETNLSLARNFKDLVREEGINFRTMKMIAQDPELVISYQNFSKITPSTALETTVTIERLSQTRPTETTV